MVKHIIKNRNKRKPISGPTQLQKIQSLIQSGCTTDAWKVIKSTLNIAPKDVPLLQEAAKLARKEQNYDDSVNFYLRALEVSPNNADLLNGLGITYYNANSFEEAEKYYLAAQQADPNYIAGYNNHAILLNKTGRYEDSVRKFQMLVTRWPNLADIRYRLAIALLQIGRLEEAECELRRAQILRPDEISYQLTLGLVLLQQERHHEGWRGYQLRHSAKNKAPYFRLPDFRQPYWQGESLEGKRIMVMTEQGRGDEIQFCRYLTRLKHEKKASRVLFTGREALRPLISSLEGLDEYVLKPDEHSFDYWCMLLDLPLWFLDTPQPFVTGERYLYCNPGSQIRWPIVSDKLKVGLVWKGSTTHDNDARRSLSHFSVLAPLLTIPHIHWVSLQKGAGEDEIAQWPQVQPLGERFENYSDTADVVDQLHLIIGVDTSVIHLAGAMGKPCWVILPDAQVDWRWLPQREDTYWYPNMRMFPRLRSECEQAVILRIEQALKSLFIVEK
ncbi:tetratricopeptide repeat protein [Enterobacter pasteurii]|uniref:tetratricopeptide repeat-containing glycosyltransferase family protein n=1 Tax=Enterobacter pasteurii TaxID=3029761 RepID=UPI0011DC962C|nr:tetratricopeptide repeat protein [Enterobacter pasteurii]QLA68099.1 tetratricopeptide repeat protein [Enterobacter pasteurii]